MKLFTDQLWQDLNKDGNINPAPTDAGLLATLKQQRPNEWSTAEITPAEGAEFNARLCGEYGASNSDNSKGVHNPFLCDALLTSTIPYIKTYYGLASVAASEDAVVDSPIAAVLSHLTRVSSTRPAR